MAVRSEEFEFFACVFIQTPSPFGYSLLAKRESCFLFVFQYVIKAPPLGLEEVAVKSEEFEYFACIFIQILLFICTFSNIVIFTMSEATPPF